MFRQPGEHRAQRVPGLVGSALRFNGKDQYVEIPASTPGTDVGEDDFTIELWIRTTVPKDTPSIVDKRDHRPVGYLIFLYQRGHPGLQVVEGGTSSSTIAKSISIADGHWHHVAGIVQRLPPQPFVIYVDGTTRPEDAAAHTPLMNLDVAPPLWLGRHHANRYVDRDDIYFQGDIDELTFYHRALTATEIQSIFRAGARGKCRPAR